MKGFVSVVMVGCSFTQRAAATISMCERPEDFDGSKMIHRECREMPTSSWTDDEKKAVAHACYDKGHRWGDNCPEEDIDTCGGDCCRSNECKLDWDLPEEFDLPEFKEWCKSNGGMIKDCDHEQTHTFGPMNLTGSCESCMQGTKMRDLDSLANTCCGSQMVDGSYKQNPNVCSSWDDHWINKWTGERNESKTCADVPDGPDGPDLAPTPAPDQAPAPAQGGNNAQTADAANSPMPKGSSLVGLMLLSLACYLFF